MILEALSLVAGSITAFWVAVASSKFTHTLLFWLLIYWIFCGGRRRRWGRCWGWGCGCGCGCSHRHRACACECGLCCCKGGGHAHHDDGEAAEPAEG